MLTVINNTTMEAIVTTDSMDVAVTWAETIPYQNDFSIIGHRAECLGAYNPIELYQLHRSLTDDGPIKQGLTRDELVPLLVRVLTDRPTTSDLPQDAKRVAPLLEPNHEENDMATKKKASKKTAAKRKTTAKKATAKKAAPKKAATQKVERERRNGMLRPKAGTVGDQVWTICDNLSKKTGEPAKRKDVMDECEKAGLNMGGAPGYYQEWRRFHGLVKKRVKDEELAAVQSAAAS